MPKKEDLSDDYVADLLVKDAKESSIKYSSMGLEAFTQSKPPPNKPKPNTRFLQNIIRSTDSHNAALLAKELAESKARLQGLSSGGDREEKASRVGGGDIRKRQLGDIAAILGGGSSKRRKTEGSRKGVKESRRVNTSSEDEKLETKASGDRKRKHKSRDEDEDDLERSRSRKSHRRHRSVSTDKGKDDDQKKRRRSRSRSRREHRSKESRHRHRSPERERSISREPAKEKRKEKSHKSHRKRRSPSSDPPRSDKKEKQAKQPKSKPDFDSDPLDEIIGPHPATVQQVRSRGRGTTSYASGIDARFAANYDPKVDVELNPDEENDWDQALEALRDRQKWKQLGPERLKAAGFTDEELKKWKKGGEKQEEDVKWAKAGEGREWDRGKVVHDDGGVSLEPSWGRLKGN